MNFGLILLFLGYLGQRLGALHEPRHLISAALIVVALFGLTGIGAYAQRVGGLASRFHSRVLLLIVLFTSSAHTLLGLEKAYFNVALLLVLGLGLILLDPQFYIRETLLVLVTFAALTAWLPNGPEAWTERILLGITTLLGWLFLQSRRSLFKEQLALVDGEERRRRELRWTLQASEARRAMLERVLEERGAQTESARRREAVRRASNDELAKVVQRYGEPDPLGRLAGGVAHDFCSLLMIFGHGLEELKGKAGRDPFALEAMSAAQTALEEMESIVGALLTYCQEQTLEFEAVELGEFLRDFVRYFANLLPERVHFEAPEVEPSVLVWIDRRQMQQVLLNLCLNAWEAMRDGGELALGVERSGGRVEISVADTGSGLPLGYEEQIFEPFFTEKPFHEGRGLGLSTVKGIVGQHGGRVWVKRSGPEGTVVAFELPLYDRATGTGRRLFLVRDPDLRRQLERLESGATLEEAETPAEIERRLRPGVAILVELEALTADEKQELKRVISGQTGTARWLLLGGSANWRGLSEEVVLLASGFLLDSSVWESAPEGVA